MIPIQVYNHMTPVLWKAISRFQICWKAKPLLPQLRPASHLRASGGRDGLLATSPTLPPHSLGLREKRSSLGCLVLCHLASVPSGYPKVTLFSRFFSEVPDLPLQIQTVAPWCRLLLSSCQLLMPPSNLGFQWLLHPLGLRRQDSFSGIPGQCFCGFHVVSWNILPFASCKWRSVYTHCGPCKQVKLRPEALAFTLGKGLADPLWRWREERALSKEILTLLSFLP